MPPTSSFLAANALEGKTNEVRFPPQFFPFQPPGAAPKSRPAASDTIAYIAETGSHVLMDRSQLTRIAGEFLKRTEAAAIGFVFTVVPLITALAICWAVSLIIQGPNERDFQIGNWSDWLIIGAFIASAAAIYWGLAAALGRSHFLSIKSANITLALSFAVYGLGLLIRSIITEGTAGKVICPILGLSDANYRPSGFDDRAPCAAFVDDVYVMIAMTFALLALFLFVTSLTLRIVLSHRHKPA